MKLTEACLEYVPLLNEDVARTQQFTCEPGEDTLLTLVIDRVEGGGISRLGFGPDTGVFATLRAPVTSSFRVRHGSECAGVRFSYDRGADAGILSFVEPREFQELYDRDLYFPSPDPDDSFLIIASLTCDLRTFQLEFVGMSHAFPDIASIAAQ
ncbi:hypothetical protein [Falsarthrobacter nasiphocae]|uniref:Uncharacterized protein n=1 Tax=Falsarthrobacter nasiphocae TaxID=189863 RepID=A0AAE3YGP6_9MICC|nr:hypothetical protein [Falsarthrobacter nasiphocae]MDR6892890.1 hypothetical protein [Falsarthrobacter nasiphocae]